MADLREQLRASEANQRQQYVRAEDSVGRALPCTYCRLFACGTFVLLLAGRWGRWSVALALALVLVLVLVLVQGTYFSSGKPGNQREPYVLARAEAAEARESLASQAPQTAASEAQRAEAAEDPGANELRQQLAAALARADKAEHDLAEVTKDLAEITADYLALQRGELTVHDVD